MALITKQEVVDKAMTNANFDQHLIKSTFIEIAELNHLKPFLGEDLYIACSGGSYVTLVNSYIKDYLAFCVKFEILPDITYNTTSQGVVDNIADFTSPVSERKLNYLRQEVYKKAETFKKKMETYLDDNANLYPEWLGCADCGGRKGGSVSKRHGIITY
mgnify:FL=1|tara:strand:+ start:194 stop:670 length:477 start_codon:yes stop_codon:yes gene_type:complete